MKRKREGRRCHIEDLWAVRRDFGKPGLFEGFQNCHIVFLLKILQDFAVSKSLSKGTDIEKYPSGFSNLLESGNLGVISEMFLFATKI